MAAKNDILKDKDGNQIFPATTAEQVSYDGKINIKQAIKNEITRNKTAPTVASMTNKEQIYVYTGTEEGYTFGNWYYWDGTAWTSGGAYNATEVNTDKTLTEEGAPADAKAAGDEFSKLKDEIANIQSGSTFEQVQADWTQDDESAPNYIKNRPFWTEEIKNVLLEEQTLTIRDEGEANYGVLFDGVPILEVSKTYIVSFNGTEYECVARQHPLEDDIVLIGNGTIVGIDDVSNNEPFIIGTMPDGVNALAVLEPGDYAVSISHTVEKNHKIDEKYLPEGCLQQSDYSQFNETASDYIKNRPFYDDIFNKTLIFTNVDVSGQTSVLLGNDFSLIDGETYTITVNDESFSTEAVSNDDGTIIYLHHPNSSSIFNDVIICLLDGENSMYRAYSWWSSGSTVSISGEFRNLKQIDNKYLNVVTSFDGKTGDIKPEDTSFVSYSKYTYKFNNNGGSTTLTTRNLISGINTKYHYALDLYATILLGYIDNETNYVAFSQPCVLRGLLAPIRDGDAATKGYVDAAIASAKPEIILNSSTEGSTKQFQITVDDSGVITATEVTE